MGTITARNPVSFHVDKRQSTERKGKAARKESDQQVCIGRPLRWVQKNENKRTLYLFERCPTTERNREAREIRYSCPHPCEQIWPELARQRRGKRRGGEDSSCNDERCRQSRER